MQAQLSDTLESPWPHGCSRSGCQRPTPHVGVHPRNIHVHSLESTTGGSGSWAQHSHSGRAHTPLSHMAVNSSSGLPTQNTHTGSASSHEGLLTAEYEFWLHRYIGDTSTGVGPQTRTKPKSFPPSMNREESSHHVWPGDVWVLAPQPRLSCGRSPDELCALPSSSFMQAQRLVANPVPRSRSDI